MFFADSVMRSGITALIAKVHTLADSIFLGLPLREVEYKAVTNAILQFSGELSERLVAIAFPMATARTGKGYVITPWDVTRLQTEYSTPGEIKQHFALFNNVAESFWRTAVSLDEHLSGTGISTGNIEPSINDSIDELAQQLGGLMRDMNEESFMLEAFYKQAYLAPKDQGGGGGGFPTHVFNIEKALVELQRSVDEIRTRVFFMG